ncbi:hypothetical protein MRX96_010973 [Rhipicephalus microplus]
MSLKGAACVLSVAFCQSNTLRHGQSFLRVSAGKSSSSISRVGRSEKIAEATERTLKTVNRIVTAFKSCRRIKDAPRKPRSRVTTEQEDAWIVAVAAVKPGLSAPQIKNTLRLESICDNGQVTPPGSGSEEQDCSPKASSSRSEQRKTAAVFSTARATLN